MKDYYEINRHKKASYLYYGLITAALAGFSFVFGVLSAVRGDTLFIVVTSFAAAVLWCLSAFVSFYIFYIANRAVLRADDGEPPQV